MISAFVFASLTSFASPSALPPGASSTTYPIPVQSLRTLCLKASRIVIARVVAVQPHGAHESKARLQVQRNLKGEGPAEIGVSFIPNMICPLPSRYTPDTTVLAFLRTSEGVTLTCGLSYGSKTLNEAELAAYRERIEAFFAIQESKPEGRERLVAEAEWLVRCVENRHTRMEGAYDLEEDLPPSYASLLNSAQRTRLHQALYDSPQDWEGSELRLLSVLSGSKDPRLTAFLIERLRARLSEAVLPFWCGSVMSTVLEREPNDAARREFDRFDSADERYGPASLGLGDPEEARRQSLKRFLAEL